MKNRCYILIMGLFTMMGCLDDNGTYEYEQLEKPVWNSNFIEQEIRSGEIAEFRASSFFTWEKDSARRASEVRYEWKYNNIIIGEKADFDILADEVFQKIGITKFDGKTKYGTFSIIEKEGGITYTYPVHYSFLSTYASKDWFIISEKDGHTELGVARISRGEKGWEIKFKENLYKMANGEHMTGRPLSICSADGARNIGSLGTITVMTDQNIYEINCENIAKISNLEDTPVQGNVKLRTDHFNVNQMGRNGMHTYIAGEDGLVYRRIMSNNSLSGSFETEPLFLDTKEYKITHFGQSLKEYDDVPCYDEKNRRMVIIDFYENRAGDWDKFLTSKLTAVTPTKGTVVDGCATVWNMPEGTKPLYLWNIFERYSDFYKVGMIYNDANGKTRLTVVTTDMGTRNAVANEGNIDIEFPGGNISKNTLFLTSSAPQESYYAKTAFVFYSKGNEIRYLNINEDFSDNDYITLPDKNDRIAFMKWAVDFYRFLLVGTEKGKLYVYLDQTRNMSGYGKPLPANPRIFCELSTPHKFVDATEIIASDDFISKDRY